ncbi:D-2-hydroxyacid dehydrogenase [Clostridium estertheticum]|uniref:D-2-hydroxyacid dehydrogenase n=1 Tax=Clostridium estertheticum TaxID=238834 RepID=UPI001C7CEE77|nr:D-2-hydroxyacid dehydrogenase [Clostridium estertheticum]MBX4262875.1 D-2-hydroxyacid dehydrogenase [Clostridium estertheticum]WLC70254.1 D-2-hydroxyacid dehydrogenase [Clostridium estertheticum]
MIRVLVTDGMEKGAIEELKNKGFEVVEKFYEPEFLGEELKNFDVIVVRSATKVRKPIIDKAAESGKLKLIIRGGVGVDNIDVAYAEEKGIKVTNTPNASSASVAELALAHMFAVSRFVNISNVAMRKGMWDKKKYTGVEIGGKTLGLIGFGRISKELAKKASVLGMTVIYTDIIGKAKGFDEYEYLELNDVLKKSDYVSLHIPFIKESGATIGKDQLAMMKDGAFLINCARGGVVDEAALVEALDNGKLAGAGVDVYVEEPTKNEALVNHPKVSVTPHIGAATKEAQTRIGAEIMEIIINFFK